MATAETLTKDGCGTLLNLFHGKWTPEKVRLPWLGSWTGSGSGTGGGSPLGPGPGDRVQRDRWGGAVEPTVEKGPQTGGQGGRWERAVPPRPGGRVQWSGWDLACQLGEQECPPHLLQGEGRC